MLRDFFSLFPYPNINYFINFFFLLEFTDFSPTLLRDLIQTVFGILLKTLETAKKKLTRKVIIHKILSNAYADLKHAFLYIKKKLQENKKRKKENVLYLDMRPCIHHIIRFYIQRAKESSQTGKI